MNLGPYSKALNTGLLALVATFGLVYADGEINLKDVLSIAITVLVAAGGVFGVRNSFRFRAAKTVVGFLAIGFGTFLSGLQDGQSVGVLLVLAAVTAVLNAISVYNSPNAVVSDADSTADAA